MQVITIQPAKYITCSLFETPVNCITLTRILFTNPKIDFRIILLNYIDTVICAPPVNYNVFKIRISLPEYRNNRLFQKLALVIRWRYYRNFRILFVR
jgi:hypothetical protein